MQDSYGRSIDYLRLSVTEACNFRCFYCLPTGYSAPPTSPLTLPEIERLIRAAVAVGLTKIRLTGGEPLARRDIVELVHLVAQIPGVQDLALTTNAFRLPELARPLAEAGLRRINVSLDTLRRKRFARITGRDGLDRVWRGLEAAEEAGLVPLKLNVVALRGLNDDEATDLGRLTVEHPWHVRFIELMPVGTSEAARELFARHFISAADVAARFSGLEPVESPQGNGPARCFRLPGARGTIGFITPTSQHFCATCNRIRVTASGVVRACLSGGQELDIRPALSRDDGQAEVEAALAEMITAKPECHPLGSEFAIHTSAMSRIGG